MTDTRPPMPWWVLPGLAVLVELVFLAALVMAWLGPDRTLVNVMCTAAIAQAMLPLNWLFGSSKSSQDKDASLAQSAATKDSTIAEQSAALAVSAPAGVQRGGA